MNDDNVDSATWFDPNDVPNSRRLDNSESLRNHYRRLGLQNLEGRNGKWVDEKRIAPKDRKAVLDAVAGQLEVTSYQRARAWHLMQDLPDATYQGNPIGLVSLCVCAIACRNDGRIYHPNRPKYANDKQFDHVREELGHSTKIVRQALHRVQQELDS